MLSLSFSEGSHTLIWKEAPPIPVLAAMLERRCSVHLPSTLPFVVLDCPQLVQREYSVVVLFLSLCSRNLTHVWWKTMLTDSASLFSLKTFISGSFGYLSKLNDQISMQRIVMIEIRQFQNVEHIRRGSAALVNTGPRQGPLCRPFSSFHFAFLLPFLSLANAYWILTAYE